MSFKEISAWLVLVAMLAVLGIYGFEIYHDGGFGAPQTKTMFYTIIGFVIVLVAAYIIVAALAPKTADQLADERDKRIELVAERTGGMVLGAVAMLALVIAVKDGHHVLANTLFIGFVGSEVVKNLWQVVLYRREA